MKKDQLTEQEKAILRRCEQVWPGEVTKTKLLKKSKKSS